ncbi:hypothetical protein SAMN02745121_01955 [Nannocystis exedens]|uniref:Secreted protein n=1 Tax=Nannocystis exedens TaxID=54 RepID=A0A1I1VTX8_9BACT|nr:hypothetical protein [Nannocystis exedens]PCC72838.1 hypothetical protein NAEX_05923 [Nannocystis exedens]SFD86371.1 hypothetical protein SAMN02745121_01955 [Nannocystis exedens]
MRRLLLVVAPALVLACSGATGTSNPPAGKPVPSTEPAPAESDSAGFATPQGAEEQPRGEPVQAEASPELAARIKNKFGERCRFERACGDLVGVDCESAVDGPYHYVRRDSLEIVSQCGGACRRGCTDCPPKAWTCPTY